MVALSKVKGKGIDEKRAYLRSIGAIMIVVRFKPNTGTFHESFPCPNCYSKLKLLGIPVYYSSPDPVKKEGKAKYCRHREH